MRKKFEFAGSGRWARTEQEMLLIDKEAANEAFKKYKKQILDSFMQENHFVKYRSRAYVRINAIGLLEYVDLLKNTYGTQTFCVNFAVMPLYYPMDYLMIGLGNRLGTYISGNRDFWWDSADEPAAKISFENIKEANCQYMFPWFENLSNEDEYKKRLIKDCSGKYISYPCEKWLEAIENHDKIQVIIANCERLRLPKKLVNSYLQGLQNGCSGL